MTASESRPGNAIFSVLGTDFAMPTVGVGKMARHERKWRLSEANIRISRTDVMPIATPSADC